jgi:zinc D-Ala-D-Ala carboxypeptidase
VRNFNTQYFDRTEFRCPCPVCQALPSPVIDFELVNILIAARAYFGSPITITSGFRCADRNRAVKGATHSGHLTGIAADIQVIGYTPEQVYAYLDTKYPRSLGLGLYDMHTHVDARARRYRWDRTT